jgi:hypothetical protein
VILPLIFPIPHHFATLSLTAAAIFKCKPASSADGSSGLSSSIFSSLRLSAAAELVGEKIYDPCQQLFRVSKHFHKSAFQQTF